MYYVIPSWQASCFRHTHPWAILEVHSWLAQSHNCCRIRWSGRWLQSAMLLQHR